MPKLVIVIRNAGSALIRKCEDLVRAVRRELALFGDEQGEYPALPDPAIHAKTVRRVARTREVRRLARSGPPEPPTKPFSAEARRLLDGLRRRTTL